MRTSLPRCERTGGAGPLSPRAPRTVRTGYAYHPKPYRTCHVPWQHRQRTGKLACAWSTAPRSTLCWRARRQSPFGSRTRRAAALAGSQSCSFAACCPCPESCLPTRAAGAVQEPQLTAGERRGWFFHVLRFSCCFSFTFRFVLFRVLCYLFSFLLREKEHTESGRLGARRGGAQTHRSLY